jgi:glycogen debranching enzyme
VFTGIFQASLFFQHQRLPEAFAGFSRDRYEVPLPYPSAAHPQAWASGALPFLLERCLGLVPLGFERRLRIVKPVLPDFIEHVELRRLRVGSGSVDIDFDRGVDGTAKVTVRDLRQELDIAVE